MQMSAGDSNVLREADRFAAYFRHLVAISLTEGKYARNTLPPLRNSTGRDKLASFFMVLRRATEHMVDQPFDFIQTNSVEVGFQPYPMLVKIFFLEMIVEHQIHI